MQLENECADTLARAAYQVRQNPTRPEITQARHDTGDTGKPDKDPDYLVEGHVFDCYSPTATKAVRGVWTAVEEKISGQQTQRVVINLHDWRGDITALQKQFDDWPIPHLKEVAAVTRNGDIIEFLRRD
ncbi:CdiA C-terminal domain-containing protein [Micromonospora yangpuensis]|uniref:CdiA C-terminal domain-containing protein n=1 Tax=Micromonospora yangpuensis TaxID=683228 RepID=UPI0015868250|nr:hypothetical protein [Micromonospora yangpuensis]